MNGGLQVAQPILNEWKSGATALTVGKIMMVDDESTTMEDMPPYLEDAGYRHFLL